MTESSEIPESTLSLEEFRKRSSTDLPMYGNFRQFFCETKGEGYENNFYFSQFEKENPEICIETKGFGDELLEIEDAIYMYEEVGREVPIDVREKFDEIENKLYEVYLTIKSYGALDSDLF